MTLYSQLTIMKFYWTNEYINSCHVKSYISYQINITYIHIIDYGLLFLHTRWMWCTVITGILNFNTCNSWSQDVVIWFFPSSLFTPRACLSQIHSHVPSCTVISTSIIFVSIATFTNMGECKGIRLSIPYARFHWANLKRDPLKLSPPKVYRHLYTLIIMN